MTLHSTKLLANHAFGPLVFYFSGVACSKNSFRFGVPSLAKASGLGFGRVEFTLLRVRSHCCTHPDWLDSLGCSAQAPSGVVRLVGPVARVLPQVGQAGGDTVDVQVQQEEALPQMYFDGDGAVNLAFGVAYYLLANFFCYLLLHTYDLHVQPGDVAWWWLLARLQTLSGQIWSHYLADCLLGRQQDCKSAVVGFLVGFLVWTLWELAWVLGFTEWKLQYFVNTLLGFEASSLVQLLVTTWLSGSVRVSPYNSARSKNNKGQAVWTGVLLSMNCVMVASQWSIIVLYMYLESFSTILSAVFLSFATAASELLTVSLIENIYVRLVWPRAFADRKSVVLGDHSAPITVLSLG